MPAEAMAAHLASSHGLPEAAPAGGTAPARTRSTPELLQAAAMLAAGKDEEALGALEAAVERDPGVSQGWFQKGMLHLARHEWAEALLCLDRAITLDETDPRAWVAKFYALERAGGRSAEAARCLIRAADLDPLFTQQWIAKRFSEDELRMLQRRYGEGQPR
jgi:tetratricopeptide (TPR) repeat protein